MFWLFLALPLVFCLGSMNAVSQSRSTPLVVNGTLGESITLPLKLPAGENFQSIIWHYDRIAIIMVPPNELGSPQFLVPRSKWKERMKFTQNYSLHLSNLTMADSGCYSAQISTETNTHFSSYTLKIFRQLSNLQVTKHIQLSGNGTCEIHLTCSVENPNDTDSFGWRDSGNVSSSEPNLTLSWDPKNSNEQNYTCIAENPVSNLSFSVSAQSLCKDVLTKESLSQDSIWIVITVLLILIVTVVCILGWKKRRGSLHLSTQQTQHPGESSENTEYTLVSSGNTVYAQVTRPNRETEIPTPTENNDTVTIYSAINHSLQNKPISPNVPPLLMSK